MTDPIIRRGKVVAIRYTLRNEKGEIVEIHDLPVAYLHGAGGDLFPAIEHALEGKTMGDQATVTLSPNEAFGPHDARLTFTDDIDNVPAELRAIGKEFEAENSKGESMVFRVTEIKDGKLTIDANHPLAGQTITFHVTVVEIRDATDEEIRSGQPASTHPSLQ